MIEIRYNLLNYVKNIVKMPLLVPEKYRCGNIEQPNKCLRQVTTKRHKYSYVCTNDQRPIDSRYNKYKQNMVPSCAFYHYM